MNSDELRFPYRSPIGRLAMLLEEDDDVTVELDDDDNAFVAFAKTSKTGKTVAAILDVVDERLEMREAAS